MLRFLQDVVSKEVPKVKANFEEFRRPLAIDHNVCHLDEILQAFLSVIAQGFDVCVWLGDVASLLDEALVLLERACDGHRDHLGEVFEVALLLRVQESGVLLAQVTALRNHGDLLDEVTEEKESFLFELLLHRFFLVDERDRANLSEELDGFDSSAGRTDQVAQNFFDKIGLEHITKRNPRQESLERFQALANEARLDGLRL